jgi:hypothetical protein
VIVGGRKKRQQFGVSDRSRERLVSSRTGRKGKKGKKKKQEKRDMEARRTPSSILRISVRVVGKTSESSVASDGGQVPTVRVDDGIDFLFCRKSRWDEGERPLAECTRFGGMRKRRGFERCRKRA